MRRLWLSTALLSLAAAAHAGNYRCDPYKGGGSGTAKTFDDCTPGGPKYNAAHCADRLQQMPAVCQREQEDLQKKYDRTDDPEKKASLKAKLDAVALAQAQIAQIKPPTAGGADDPGDPQQVEGSGGGARGGGGTAGGNAGGGSPTAAAAALVSKSQDALKNGDLAGAKQAATEAIAADPRSADAYLARAQARALDGDKEGARGDAREALALGSKSDAAGMLAKEDLDWGRAGRAATKGSKLAFGATADPGALGDAGRPGAAQAARDLPPAAAPPRPALVYDLAKPLTPTQLLVLSALKKLEMGDAQGAYLALTQAIDQDPTDAGAFLARAEAGNALGKYAEAILDAKRALELAPTNAMLSARALRAKIYAEIQLKDWASALADANRAIILDPKSGLSFLYRAMAEDKLGDGDGAARDVAQAVALDPALSPLALPLLRKYGGAAPGASTPAARSLLLRAACAALALGLVLAGILGKAARKNRLTTTAVPR
jgi:Tfp pilus assembly protein PilF